MTKHTTLADVLGDFSGKTALYQQLGEFICNYALVEQACHSMFDQMSGLPRAVARTIMGGKQLHEVLTVLTNVIELKNMEESIKKEFHTCLTQLRHIATLRNNLIHRGASAEGEGKIKSSNEMLARSKEAIEILEFHIDDLKSAVTDTENLFIRLSVIELPDVRSRLGALEHRIYAPWRYKPLQPEKPHQLPHKGSQ